MTTDTITRLIQAAEQAREALKDASSWSNYGSEDAEYGFTHCCGVADWKPHKAECNLMRTITTLTAAIEAAKEQASWDDSIAASRIYITALEHALKHKEAENAELRNVVDAAKNLIAQKGRHHTQIAYERLETALAAHKSWLMGR